MKLEKNYLSDEELEQLILDVERKELVTAPPDLLDRIISEVETIQPRNNHQIEKSDISKSNYYEVERTKMLESNKHEVERERMLESNKHEVERERMLESNKHEVDRIKMSESKVKEFRGYCFRVLTSVAAAIVIVFLLPEVMNVQYCKNIPYFMNIQHSETFLKQEIASKTYKTKEELLNDTNILMETFGGTNIFDNDNKWNIFNGKNGGY